MQNKTNQTPDKASAQNQTAAPKQRAAGRHKVLWSVVFVFIAAATVWAVIAQSRTFSLRAFVSFLENADVGWMTAALVSMLGFIVFEGESVLCICQAFGYPRGHRKGFIYAASDIYFSAITPSATGGQPMCAYFMMKDKIPGIVVTVALVLNLAMYTLSILVINVVNVIFGFQVITSFGTLSLVLIAVGFVIQIALVLMYILLLKDSRILKKGADAGLRLLAKLRLLKNVEAKRQALQLKMEEYDRYAAMLRGHKKMMLRAFLMNLAQRACSIAVTVFTFLATGGGGAAALKIWTLQSFVVIGSVSIPIPGAMGVTDYLMLDGFDSLMSAQNAANLELLSRSLSFYVCVLICGISVLIKYLLLKRGKK